MALLVGFSPPHSGLWGGMLAEGIWMARDFSFPFLMGESPASSCC